MNAAMLWIILSGLYGCQVWGAYEQLEYTAARWTLDKDAGSFLGRSIYKSWYCWAVGLAFLNASSAGGVDHET